MFGAISEKFRTFYIQIIFAILPFSKLRNFYHFINQLVRKVENFLGISRQSLFRLKKMRPFQNFIIQELTH